MCVCTQDIAVCADYNCNFIMSKYSGFPSITIFHQMLVPRTDPVSVVASCVHLDKQISSDPLGAMFHLFCTYGHLLRKERERERERERRGGERVAI